MTCIIDTKSKRHLSAKLAAGLAISAFLVLGTFVAAASAAQHGGGATAAGATPADMAADVAVAMAVDMAAGAAGIIIAPRQWSMARPTIIRRR